MISKMRYASITVTDIDKAIDFYVNKLGFHVVVNMPIPDGNQFIMAALPDGGTNLVFSLPLAGRDHTPSNSIAFETEDVEKTYKELDKNGVSFLRKPAKTAWGGVEALFVDPFGNHFLLQQGGQ